MDSTMDDKRKLELVDEEENPAWKKPRRRFVIDSDSSEDENDDDDDAVKNEKQGASAPETSKKTPPEDSKTKKPSPPKEKKKSTAPKKAVPSKKPTSGGLSYFQKKVEEKKAMQAKAAAAVETSGGIQNASTAEDPKGKAKTSTHSFFQPRSSTLPKAPSHDSNKTKSQEENDDDDASNIASTQTPSSIVLPAPTSLLKASKGSVKSNQDIVDSAPDTWNENNRMPYAVLCQAFSRIEDITSRLEIQQIMTELFRLILIRSVQDLYPCLYLASNSVAPAYECVELGIGDAILIKAIGEATGTNPNMVKQKYEQEGDLGKVAQSCKSKQSTLSGFFQKPAADKTNKPASLLTAQEVLTTFREIAETKGNHSQKWKVDKIKKLLVKATESTETKYIVRGLQGKLRIGLAQSTVLISLAHALAYTRPNTVEDVSLHDKDLPQEVSQYLDQSLPVEKRLEGAVAVIKRAYSEVPSYDALLDAALKAPLEGLHKVCTLTPGIPVAPMLAKPTKSVQEVLKRLNGVKFTCEYKYDGERAQVHLLQDGTARVFSRNLLDTSEKYPEVPIYVREACKDNVTSFVLDAEVVAFNNDTGKLVPFQILSTRKKTEDSHESAKVKVIVQAFDLMYLNGESLLSKTLEERRSLMHENFQSIEGKFQFATSLDHQEDGDTTILEDFLDAAVKGQCEGLMVKTLVENSNYEPSRRSLNWLKLKKDYLEGLGDSVDLVPLGAYHGKGKRTGVYGAYLLACFDPDTEEFQSVCKIGTGFSDEDLKTLAEGLNKHVIPSKSSQYNVSDQLECDVWFDSVQVWEVKAADLSKSSAHRGAVDKTGEQGRGIGLRFPRFERLRDDKKPEDATTSDQILDMYYRQDTVGGSGGGVMDEDDDGI